ncbi:S1C family serine protease [Roseimaritima ulvae]|uniref:Putative periplasmic serine endoprotease DegP-like n=1 Tax=Roseimaritima ulvae TaxID=980254 RepID=A0A5B9QRN0_9BACT|nr:trypsin-like peptidase domain-containing protein [Roseimaritima ulvae]QEG41757.1 putative periplasmic serine endoprotease DegP-like precursor [Roseimaritima ulvae]
MSPVSDAMLLSQRSPRRWAALWALATLVVVCSASLSRADEPAATAVAEPLSASMSADTLPAFEAQIQQAFEKVRSATVGFGGGSAVVVSEDGLLLSVAHVGKRPGRRLRVTFPDGRRTHAKVLGLCDDLDIAVAKIDEPGPWPAVDISRVDMPAENTWLLKVGYPVSFRHGQQPAVRVGRLLRKMPDAFISDCPIMGGDSGGPIFDLDGNLVGISSRCQDEIKYNLHIPLTSFYEHWTALCSGRALKRAADGTLRPSRPDWEPGFGRNPEAMDVPFPGSLSEQHYASRKPAIGQTTRRRGRQPLPPGRQADEYLNGLSEARQAAEQSTVEVLLGERVLAAGTLLADANVSKHQSFVATKASLLGRDPQELEWSVRVDGHQENFAAAWVGADSRRDLAIFSIEHFPDAAMRADAESETDAVALPQPFAGAPVLCLASGGHCLVGFVSATPRSFAMRQPPLMRDRPMLGISVATHEQGVRITSLVKDSGAAKAGLLVDDILQQIDGQEVSSADELVSVIAKRRIGDVLPLQLLRDGETQSVEAKLGKFQTTDQRRPSFDNWGGGPFSDRRFEIPHVLPHDTPLPPEDCGSPLVDSHGRIIGVNIARALRTTSYALPIDDVWQTIADLRQL